MNGTVETSVYLDASVVIPLIEGRSETQEGIRAGGGRTVTQALAAFPVIVNRLVELIGKR